MKFEKPLTLDELLEIIQGDIIVKGNSNNIITGINEIHSVQSGNLSFVDHPKYYARVLESAAGVILINSEVAVPEGKTLLISQDPFSDYIKVVRHFVKFKPQSDSINPNAVIGENTVIQPNSFIGDNVIIGKNCIIHSNVSIYANTIIGNNVIIHSGAVIGADAYYFQNRNPEWKKLESCGRTVISDDVEIGCNVTIDKGVSGDTYIGKGTKFDNIVQVGHDTYIGAHCLIGSLSAIAGCTYIDDECILWAKSSVNKDLYVAKHTTLLALSAIDKSVPEEGAVLFGVPAYEARKKWKEMACSKKLPDLFDEFYQLKNDFEALQSEIKSADRKK